jgi:hypothetical protein
MTTALIMLRDDMLDAFKTLRKLCKPQPEEEAIVSYDGACLHFELGGMAVTPAAKGSWAGQARVPGKFILGLAKLPPNGDSIQIRMKDGRFYFGSSSIECKWQPAWSKQIELPINPSITDLLTLRFHYTDEDIATSGLAQSVRKAENGGTSS